jgi:Ca-activated chloride channel family protein
MLLLVTALSAVAQEQLTLKVGVDLVNVLFTVTDRKGRLVSGLKESDFAVEEEGRKQEILHFSGENELPLTIGLLVDTSPSVRPVFPEEKTTAIAFLESILRNGDLAMVIGFDRSVTLVQDYTESPKYLRSAIDDLEIGGGTSLFDAVYLATGEKLAKETGRKAIVLISDGEDTTSKVPLNDALIAAHKSDSVIYSISNGGGFGRLRSGGGDPRTLRKLSEETGGDVFFVRNQGDFERIFATIERDLRSQYSLAYRSSNTAQDGKYRRIKIIPRDPSLQIRARKGYYAAKSDSGS